MKAKWLILGLVGILLIVAMALTAAQEPAARSIVENGAKVALISDGFSFTEGPAGDKSGNVYFTDQPNDRILIWKTNGTLLAYREGAGRANGLSFDDKGNLWVCADEKNELWRISSHGETEVMVKDFEGKLLNGPNDVWIRPDGGVYFTDPYYQRDYWKHRKGGPEMPPGVYFFEPKQKKLIKVVDDMEAPNGIIGDAGGKILYVADLKGNKTFKYEIQKDGTLANKKLFCEMGSDGMTIDNEGNVYLTGRGVTVFDPSGHKIEQIPISEPWTAMSASEGKMATLSSLPLPRVFIHFGCASKASAVSRARGTQIHTDKHR